MSSTIKNKSKLYSYYNFSLNQSILDVFVLQGVIDLEDAERLRKYFKTNRDLEKFLLKNRLVTQDSINKAYSIILKLPFIELNNVEIPAQALASVPMGVALKYGVIPFDMNGSLLKIATTRPSDLSVGFPIFISKLKGKNLDLEIFVTGTKDFKESLKQYQKKNREIFLLKKGSLPVVYLRNRSIPKVYLRKLPKQFIEKNRVVVFDRNIVGDYLLACETPDSATTRKIIEYIKRENKIDLELFAASKSDIDYALEIYEQERVFQIETGKKQRIFPDKTSSEKLFEFKQKTVKPVSGLVKNFFRKRSPSITFDTITGPRKEIISEKEKIFQNPSNRSIMESKEEGTLSSSGHLASEIDLKERMKKDYLSKLPGDFIKKFRVVVFDEDKEGNLLIATERKQSKPTENAIDFIKKQHPVKVFNVSPEEIDYALAVY